MTMPRVFSIECESVTGLIKATLNVEKIFQTCMLEGEHYLTETFTMDGKHFLVVTVWNSEE
jgi:hypothetical protein